MVYYATAHFKPTPPHHTCFCSFWSNWKPLNTFHLKIIWIPHSAKPSDPLWIPGGTLCSIQFTHLWQYESPCLLATEIINPTKAFFPSTKSSSLFLPCLFFLMFVYIPSSFQMSHSSQLGTGSVLVCCNGVLSLFLLFSSLRTPLPPNSSFPCAGGNPCLLPRCSGRGQALRNRVRTSQTTRTHHGEPPVEQ